MKKLVHVKSLITLALCLMMCFTFFAPASTVQAKKRVVDNVFMYPTDPYSYPTCTGWVPCKKTFTSSKKASKTYVRETAWKVIDTAYLYKAATSRGKVFYIDIPSLGLGVEGNPEKKIALFLVMPSGDSSYNLFINMFYTQLFTVLKRIADNRRDGQLPIHVRLWADEYYAGPKPLNCETLLGEIRSRNMSIVPILQDIAQIKTLYPNDKWEIFTGNCATTVFLGSGATAHTTHQWISDMLEDMTIDSRSENLGHSQGGGNLQMSKGGMKLMTPGQVSRMPKNDCILFLKGERPIYDKKNWSFDTEVFKEAQEIAGKNGYKNPVYVSYDEENRQYTTTRFESRLNYISQEDYEFYEEKAKTDDNIQTFQIDEDAFLYLNFNETPQPSLRELEKMVKKIQVSENSEEDENEGDEKKEDTVQDRKKWDLSGDIMDCFQRYSSELSQEEQEEIIKGIEDGLTDQEIKRYFALYGADKMQQYRRVLTARKNRG